MQMTSNQPESQSVLSLYCEREGRYCISERAVPGKVIWLKLLPIFPIDYYGSLCNKTWAKHNLDSQNNKGSSLHLGFICSALVSRFVSFYSPTFVCRASFLKYEKERVVPWHLTTYCGQVQLCPKTDNSQMNHFKGIADRQRTNA